MSGTVHFVTIKGTKEGLVFLFDEQREFAELMQELKEKLNQSFEKFVDDTVTTVILKFGKRNITKEQEIEIYTLFAEHPKLIVKAIEVEPDQDAIHIQKLLEVDLITHRGTIRSGQVLEHKGNLLLIGDINPGGSVIVTGDLYVMGALRGMAHAGADGNEQSTIAASQMFPSQLRIASIISRPPDEWVKEDSYMEFAYLENGHMKLDKITNLTRRK